MKELAISRPRELASEVIEGYITIKDTCGDGWPLLVPSDALRKRRDELPNLWDAVMLLQGAAAEEWPSDRREDQAKARYCFIKAFEEGEITAEEYRTYLPFFLAKVGGG